MQGNRIGDPIDGSIGEGSQFDETFGYYAHAITEGTAQLPDGWQARATTLAMSKYEGLSCVCPDVVDIALSKVATWREKDVAWLRSAVLLLPLDLAAMRDRAAAMPATSVSAEEMRRRLEVVVSFAGRTPEKTANRTMIGLARDAGAAEQRSTDQPD